MAQKIPCRELMLQEFENMKKVRLALDAWKARHAGCINPLPDELCQRFAAFAQDALRRDTNNNTSQASAGAQ